MKIVRRVSLYRAVERLGEPTKASFKLSRSYNDQTAEWKMPVDYELFKYGYRNKPKTYTMAILGICAYLVGITLHSTELELRNNQVRTIYSYRLRESTQSPILLAFRRFLVWALGENIMGELFPAYQFFKFYGIQGETEEKHIRHKQYQYYKKHRDDKYDFMELGVLEKFPYPINTLGQKPM